MNTPKLRTQAFEAGDVKGTVREETGMDSIDVLIVTGALDFDRTKRTHIERVLKFADFVLRTVEIEGLPFEWVNADSEEAAINAAFEQWQQLPRVVISAWNNALFDVTKAPNAGE